MSDRPDWDTYFMTMAYLVATRSKDPSTHVGAVIVGPSHEVRSTGYNGLPQGVRDGEERMSERPEKYLWTEHAERSAIFQAALVGVPLEGCRMYTCGFPCADCARAIIQAGLVEVIYDHDWVATDDRREWQKSFEASRVMFTEAGVVMSCWRGDLVGKIIRFRGGKEF